MKTTISLLTLISILSSGCVHKINYKLTEKDRWTGPKIEGAVFVRPFADETASLTNKEEVIDGKEWRTNYRKGYADTNLAAAVTGMVAKQIAWSGLFSKGVSSSDKGADWILSGTLADFSTYAQVNEKAENIQAVSAGFGLLGAIVGGASTSKMTSNIKTRVELRDLTLADKSARTVWQDSITISNLVAENFAAANQYAVFHFPDQKLKEAVAEMIERMGRSMTNRTLSSLH